MREDIVAAITKTTNRSSLFHFTRTDNLSAIAHLDSLLSSSEIDPSLTGERRLRATKIQYDEYSMTINAHLKIPDLMMDASITQEQFRTCLDRHVFFWPTLKDCQKMLDTYARREPGERFAVLEFDAYRLMTDHYSAVKLSKYDSGSAPRFPKTCSYRKSLEMFLPLDRYKLLSSSIVPTKASEIREVLIEDRVMKISDYLQSVYVDRCEDAPMLWRTLIRPLAELRTKVGD
jgi:predicted DNA-binding protein